MKILYNRVKRCLDRVVRCYLTYQCSSNCSYCSAGIPKVLPERRNIYIPAEVWAEGINRRNRHTVLAGGEPFLYPEWGKLISLLDNKIKYEIYTNLKVNVNDFLANAKKKFIFLVSLHSSVKDFEAWYKQVEKLRKEGHSVRCHVVKADNWQERRNFLQEKGLKVTCCDNQNTYDKSKGIEENKKYPLVTCSYNVFAYAPDGYRYHCVTHLMKGTKEARLEHITESDSKDLHTMKCKFWGFCEGCDNLGVGKVIYEE